MEYIEKELAKIRSPDYVLKLLGWTVTKFWTKSLLIADLFKEIWKHSYHVLEISYSHRFTSSCFSVLKKLSIMAFSYGLTMHTMLTRKPWFLSSPTYSFEAHCTPRTDWWMMGARPPLCYRHFERHQRQKGIQIHGDSAANHLTGVSIRKWLPGRQSPCVCEHKWYPIAITGELKADSFNLAP